MKNKLDKLVERKEKLNSYQFKKSIYTNNLGTNFDYLSFPEGRNIVIEGEEFLLEQNDNVEDNNIEENNEKEEQN